MDAIDNTCASTNNPGTSGLDYGVGHARNSRKLE